MATATPKRSSGRKRGAARKDSPTRDAKRKVAANATTRKARPPAAARKAADAAKQTAGSAKDKITPSSKPKLKPKRKLGGLAGFAARKALKAMARGAAKSTARALQSASERTADVGRSALDNALSRRLPVQVSIDVAVPPAVAWEEWINSGSLTEGVHLVEDVERSDGTLVGKIAGPRSSEWEAEIVDERQQESFAWRSREGSDCAGLVTFHQLSDRLTRVELDLDVLPVNPAQALSLALHLAHHHAEAELRRFKARVEFINPDVYEPDQEDEETEPDQDEKTIDGNRED